MFENLNSQIPSLEKISQYGNMQDYYVSLSKLFKGKHLQSSLVLNSITRKFFIETGKSHDEATILDFLRFYTNFNDWENIQNLGEARQNLAKKLIAKIHESLE